MKLTCLTVAFAWPVFIQKTQAVQSLIRLPAVEHSEVVDWELCNAEVYSNLGGVGGYNVPVADGGNRKKEIRYGKIATLGDGRKIDMVITNTTGYLPSAENPKQAKQQGNPTIGGQWMNGKLGCLGRLNIHSPGEVSLKFRLVYAGTDTVIPAATHDFTIFDFDTSEHAMVEEITAKEIDSYYTKRIEPVVQGDMYVFSGAGSVQVDNPSDRFDLTPEQLAATVGLVYSTSEWELKFAAVDTNAREENNRADRERRERERRERAEQRAADRDQRDKDRDERAEERAADRDQRDKDREESRDKRAANRGKRLDIVDMDSKPIEGGRNFLFAGQSLVQTKGMPIGICEIYGDPHIIGFDKMARGVDTAAHVTERGDFWLAKTKDLAIQGRYSFIDAWEAGQVGLTTLVVGGGLLGGGKLMVERQGGPVTCFGQTIAPEQNFVKTVQAGTIKITVSSIGVDVSLPYQTFLRIERYDTHLVAKMSMPRPAGGTDGHCGNFNGDPDDDTLEEIVKRMTPRVADSESLFK